MIRSLHLWQSKDIETVELLGSDEKTDWELSENGLMLMTPKNFEEDLAYVFKIKCAQSPLELSYSSIGLQSSQ